VWHGFTEELVSDIKSFCKSETINDRTEYYWDGSIDDFLEKYNRYPVMILQDHICITQYNSFIAR